MVKQPYIITCGYYNPESIVILESFRAAVSKLWPGLNLACCLLLQIGLYWNIAMLIPLSTIDDCFHAIIAELSSCNRNLCYPQILKYLLSGHGQKKFVNPCSRLLNNFLLPSNNRGMKNAVTVREH